MQKHFQSINPSDGNVLQEFVTMDSKTVSQKLSLSNKAFKAWRNTNFNKRADLMLNVANGLRQKKEELARLMTLEMGKTLNEARAEIEKCAGHAVYFAEHSKKMLKPETISTEALKSTVAFEPTGCVFAIMPWNFPFWQVFRYAVPTLMSGNVTMLKHAPNVCGCALACEQIFLEAGFPEGVFQTLIIDVDLVEQVIADDIVQGVTLTGSEYAGSAVAALAGKHIKKSVLELGGSDALIVLNDADLEKAATTAVASRMGNAGQVCIAAKRLLIENAVYEQFTDLLLHKIKAIKQGNGLLEGITMGPLARPDLAHNLHRQIESSLAQGATLMCGGDFKNCHFEPTFLTQVTPKMKVFQEETFGPLAVAMRVKDANEAIKIANASRYGLGGSVWTNDIKRGAKIAAQLESGAVFVNSLVKSDSRLPLGGIKKSGFGRELSEAGIKEFMNIKTIYIGQ